MDEAEVTAVILRWFCEDLSRFEGDPRNGIDPMSAGHDVIANLPSLRPHYEAIVRAFSLELTRWDGRDWSLDADSAVQWLLSHYKEEIFRDLSS